jgi:DNA-binding MarR family transcriptional regulator
MKTPIDQEQIEYIREFIALLGHQVKKCADTQIKKCAQTSQDACKITNQELTLLFLLNERGTLAVKEIACNLDGISLSTLTRMLDKLEEHAYITRLLDKNDRRSFLITPTDKAYGVVESYKLQMQSVAYTMLEALTPAERLVLIELYNKIRQNLKACDLSGMDVEEVPTGPYSS